MAISPPASPGYFVDRISLELGSTAVSFISNRALVLGPPAFNPRDNQSDFLRLSRFLPRFRRIGAARRGFERDFENSIVKPRWPKRIGVRRGWRNFSWNSIQRVRLDQRLDRRRSSGYFFFFFGYF